MLVVRRRLAGFGVDGLIKGGLCEERLPVRSGVLLDDRQQADERFDSITWREEEIGAESWRYSAA